MDQFIAGYLNLMTGFVKLFQQLGIATLPIGIAATAVINMIGGEKGMRAAGIGILILGALNVLLLSSIGLGGWISGLAGGAAVVTAAVATPVP